MPTLMLEVLFRLNLSSITPNVHPCSPITSIFPKISIVFLNFSHFLQFSSIFLQISSFFLTFLHFSSIFLIFPSIFLNFPHCSSIFLMFPSIFLSFPQFFSIFLKFSNFLVIFQILVILAPGGQFFLGGSMAKSVGKTRLSTAYPLLNPKQWISP